MTDTFGKELSIRGVGKRYAGSGDGAQALQVLQDINLDVPAGRFVSIVGASGCGKSTLLRLILGLDDDYSGQILLDGKPVQGAGLDRGIVFQDHRLFPWLNVERNIAAGLRNAAVEEYNRMVAAMEEIAAGFNEQIRIFKARD